MVPISLIDAIADILEQPQLIIATHSVKLLAESRPNTVFFLKREDKTLRSLNQLNDEQLELFLTLYGDEAPGAWLSAIFDGRHAADSHLGGCAEDIGVPHADDPRVAPQLEAAARLCGPSAYALLDFGAGNGSILAYLLRRESPPFTYIGLDLKLQRQLQAKFCEAQGAGRITSASELIEANLAQDHALRHLIDLDVVVLINVLHELPWHQIPDILARLLASLRVHGVLGIFDPPRLERGEPYAIVWSNQQLRKLGLATGVVTSEPAADNLGVVWRLTKEVTDEAALAQSLRDSMPLLAVEMHAKACEDLSDRYALPADTALARWTRSLLIAQSLTQVAHLSLAMHGGRAI